jgi:ABC-2 type transport system permease protein
VKTGEIANDLQRPVDFFWYWAAQDLGRAVSQALMRGIPLLLAFGIAYPIVLPADPGQAALLGVSLGLAWFCAFAWRFMFSLVAFWTSDAMGVARIAIFVQMFLAGFFLPVAFFPEPVAAVMRALPFIGMVNTPVDLFVNAARGGDALAAVALQAFWAIALFLGARAVLASGIRRLTIQGG